VAKQALVLFDDETRSEAALRSSSRQDALLQALAKDHPSNLKIVRIEGPRRFDYPKKGHRSLD
jgi:hypothetical protein